MLGLIYYVRGYHTVRPGPSRFMLGKNKWHKIIFKLQHVYPLLIQIKLISHPILGELGQIFPSRSHI